MGFGRGVSTMSLSRVLEDYIARMNGFKVLTIDLRNAYNNRV
jgi:hypothetical protein